MKNEEIVSLLVSKEDNELRTALIQDIRVKFVKIARSKGIPSEDINDVVNDGVEKLLKKVSTFHGKGPFNHWAIVLMGNQCLDYHRRSGVKKRIFDTTIAEDSSLKDESFCEKLDGFPDKTPDPSIVAENRQRLNTLLSVIDEVISQTANLRKQEERDGEIARLGLKELLEPKEILEVLTSKYPGMSLNAIRIVLHEFRCALFKAVEKDERQRF